MAKKVLTTSQELQELVASLPTIQPGFVRVFRGQSRKFKTINASAHRGLSVWGRKIWDSYLFLLSKSIVGLNENVDEQKVSDLDIMYFWVHALSQHYGPGTEYLDVSYSMDVALWFAFHDFEKRTAKTIHGIGDAINASDILCEIEYGTYHKVESNGWLYIFDIPVSLDKLDPQSGTVIDVLQDAPAIFQNSGRLAAQKACLIKCDPTINNGDCTGLLTVQPIEIAYSAVDSRVSVIDLATLFPSPMHDEWYRRFLSVPYIFGGVSDAGQLLAHKLLPVEVYFDQIGQTVYSADVLENIIVMNPLSAYLDSIEKEDEHVVALKEANPIVFFAPILSLCPNINSKSVNKEVLWCNAGLKPQKKAPKELKDVVFNIFFEFSPLEIPDWLSIEKGKEAEWIRAIWLINFGNELLKVKTMVQSLNSPDHNCYQIEYWLWYDPQKRALRFRSGAIKDGDIAKLGHCGQAIFAALGFVGDIRDGEKIKPFASLVSDDTEGIVVISDKSATLKSGPVLPMEFGQYYWAAHIETNEPYFSMGQHLEYYKAVPVENIHHYNELPFRELEKLKKKALHQN